MDICQKLSRLKEGQYKAVLCHLHHLTYTCMELLSNTIAKDPTIQGININGKEIKQTFFTNDGTYINNSNTASFERLIHAIGEFAIFHD